MIFLLLLLPFLLANSGVTPSVPCLPPTNVHTHPSNLRAPLSVYSIRLIRPTGTQGHGVQGMENAGARRDLPHQLRPRWPHGGLGQHLHGELGSPSRRQLPGTLLLPIPPRFSHSVPTQFPRVVPGETRFFFGNIFFVLVLFFWRCPVVVVVDVHLMYYVYCDAGFDDVYFAVSREVGLVIPFEPTVVWCG